jgi:hypothetical protein
MSTREVDLAALAFRSRVADVGLGAEAGSGVFTQLDIIP